MPRKQRNISRKQRGGAAGLYTVVKDPMFDQRKKEYLSKRSEEIDALRSEIKRLEDPSEIKTEFSREKTQVSVETEKATLQKAKEDYDRLQTLITSLEDGATPAPIPGTKWFDPYRDMVGRIALYRKKEAEVGDASKKKHEEIDASPDSNQKVKDTLYWDNFFGTEKSVAASAADAQQVQLDALLKDYKQSTLTTSQADLEKARVAYQTAKDAIELKQGLVDTSFQEFVKVRQEDIDTYKTRLTEILVETKTFLENNLVAETKEELANLSEKSKIELLDLKKRSDGEIYTAQLEATSGQFDWQRKRAEVRLPDLHTDAEKDRANLLQKYKEYEEKILADAELNWNSIQDIYYADLKTKNNWAAVKPTTYFDLMASSSKKQADLLKAKADIASFEPTRQVVEDSLRQEGAAKLALDSATATGSKEAIAAAQKTYDTAKASADKARTDTATAAQMKQDLEAKEGALRLDSADALLKRKSETPIQEISVPQDTGSLKDVISTAGDILESLPLQYTTTPEYTKAMEAIEKARALLATI